MLIETSNLDFFFENKLYKNVNRKQFYFPNVNCDLWLIFSFSV